MDHHYFVSVIIPIYNAGPHLEKCLAAVRNSSYSFCEIIVVDDGSEDYSSEIALKQGAILLRHPRRMGPAAARNTGAQKAGGDILFFVDADVVVRKETIARVVRNFGENPDIAAIFGSYDDSPAEINFFSQYKNLVHHYVHQQSRREAITFWAACGAIRKEVFDIIGGFNQKNYSQPSIEDIELGYRLRKKGYRILLDKGLQVKHLKKWQFTSLLTTDIFYRAVPWTKLILESGKIPDDLNLQISQKISAGLVGLIAAMIPLSFYRIEFICIIVSLLFTILFINHKLFLFLLRRKGWAFIFPAFAMHVLYYFYSSVTYVLFLILYKVGKHSN